MIRLKELRKKAHLTQEELISQFNIKYGRKYTAAAISQFENGKRIPETQSLMDFADFFNVSTDYLLGRTEEPHTTEKRAPSPDLSPKEEREIEDDLEDMINSMASATYESDNGEQEDIEALQATLRAAMIQAKRIAKKKYTPRKYRKD